MLLDTNNDSRKALKTAVISRQKVFTRFDYLMFIFLTVLTYVTVFYTMMPLFYLEDWQVNPLAFSLLMFIFFSRLAVSQLRWWILPFMTKPERIPPRVGWRVGVATSFVPGAESVEMLEETVKALVAMDYSHDTWVLDEGDDEAVRALCSRLGVFHFSRKGLARYQTPGGTFQSRSKHGNYNSWLEEIGYQKYDIIASFDPDHIPQADFLTEALGYFEDPQIGYVQAAQAYYNQKASFIARGAAEETYSYYSSTQMSCYTLGYPIVTGCHTTQRVTALKQVGGFPAHDADDLLITLFYRTSGWSGVYIPKVLARGLTPVDWDGYLKQQLRWARSVLDIKFRIHPKLFRKLGFKEVVTSFLHGFYYLQGATMLLIFILLAYMLATGYVPRSLNYFISLNFLLLTSVLILCDFYRQRFFLDRKSEWGVHWRAGLLQFAKYPYLLLALAQVVLNRRFAYAITGKVKAEQKTYKPFLPHLFVAALICAAWLFGAMSGHDLPLPLHIAAALTVIGTLVLTATGYRAFPAPYDKRLSPANDKKKADILELNYANRN